MNNATVDWITGIELKICSTDSSFAFTRYVLLASKEDKQGHDEFVSNITEKSRKNGHDLFLSFEGWAVTHGTHPLEVLKQDFS